MKKYLLASTFLLSTLGACVTESGTGITSADLSCDATLTYANFGSAFIDTNCLSCHATREEPRLSTQADVQANAGRILEAAVYSTSMPRGADLSLDERTLLGNWLTCGAP